MRHHMKGCPSLNDCLLTGPNLNPNLLDMLIKFRLHKIAFQTDITKAFLQIALAEKDKVAVRFLWLHGTPTKDCEKEMRIMRMKRVVLRVSPSPFLLAATMTKHIKQYEKDQPRTVESLRVSLRWWFYLQLSRCGRCSFSRQISKGDSVPCRHESIEVGNKLTRFEIQVDSKWSGACNKHRHCWKCTESVGVGMETRKGWLCV